MTSEPTHFWQSEERMDSFMQELFGSFATGTPPESLLDGDPVGIELAHRWQQLGRRSRRFSHWWWLLSPLVLAIINAPVVAVVESLVADPDTFAALVLAVDVLLLAMVAAWWRSRASKHVQRIAEARSNLRLHLIERLEEEDRQSSVRARELLKQRRLASDRAARLARIRPKPRLFKTWEEAEEIAAEWMKYLGYVDSTVTPSGPDGGVDVESKDAIAQVKAWTKPVGVEVAQRTYGVARASDKTALLFSLAGYTSDAVEWSNGRVALFEFDHSGGVEPSNSDGAKLMAQADARSLG